MTKKESFSEKLDWFKKLFEVFDKLSISDEVQENINVEKTNEKIIDIPPLINSETLINFTPDFDTYNLIINKPYNLFQWLANFYHRVDMINLKSISLVPQNTNPIFSLVFNNSFVIQIETNIIHDFKLDEINIKGTLSLKAFVKTVHLTINSETVILKKNMPSSITDEIELLVENFEDF